MESLQSISDELVQMADDDQAMRRRAMNGEAEWDSAVDARSQVRLMAIIEEHSWPTITKVGAEASNAAWLLAQHAPDLDFMERCLELMESLPPGDVKPANIAYLKDRILMLHGEPQIYGTQFQGTGKAMQVYPIEDAAHVDERRAAVGLSSFAENEARLRELYNAEH